jgi:hypothetical protein
VKCFRCGSENKSRGHRKPINGLVDRGGGPVEAFSDNEGGTLPFVPFNLGAGSYGADTSVRLCQDCAGLAVAFLKGQAVPAPPKIVQKDLITA